MRRVVITGIAGVTPLGNTFEETWKALLEGKSGIAPITLFDATDFSAKIAGEVKNFSITHYGVDAKTARRMDRFSQFAVASAHMLLKDSTFTINASNEFSTAVILGVGIGGLETIAQHHHDLATKGPNKISPFMIPMLISNMAPGSVAMAVGAKGMNIAVTSACASGTHAVGVAFDYIRSGRAEAILTGGTEASITPLGISGFTALKALSVRNDDPEHASRPFSASRDGFVMGEGCGLLLLESLDSALARNATIYAEVVGFGATDDAYHMTAPDEECHGMVGVMKMALQDAQITPEQVQYVNAHGTSTQLNDMLETKAIKMVFGNHAHSLAISSNKSQLGHLLGAAGGIELAITAKAIQESIVPATMNLTDADPTCDLDYIPNTPRKMDIEYAISNSFGFGGTNACVVLKRFRG